MQSAYIHLYLIMINVITFALYGLDKWRAMTRQWRVREKKLIILALIGGSIGALIGMTVFHHKIRKWYFRTISGNPRQFNYRDESARLCMSAP